MISGMREGHKHTELGIIPDNWGICRFKEVAKISQGLQIAISDRYKDYKENRYVYVTVQYINDRENPENIYYIESPSKNVICFKDDILVSRTGNTGIIVTGIEGVFHNNFFKVDFNRSLLLRDYLFYFLKSHPIQKLIKQYAGITTIPDLNHGEFYRIPVLLPPLPEQKKIAEILSTVDEQIKQTDALIEKIKEFKKGLMQQLLTKGIGHTRFKKAEFGEIPEEWELFKIGDIVDVMIGGTPSRKEPRYWDTAKKTNNIWVSIKDLPSTGRYVSDSTEYITDVGIANSNVKLIPEKTVLMSFKLTIGKTAITKCSLYTNEAIAAFKINDSQIVDYLFLFYILPHLTYDADTAIKGATLNKQKLLDGIIPLPNIQEQRNIASVLMSIDNCLDEYIQIKNTFQLLKQGLMQKLLTGQIRVQV